jgi:hypothetical protein
MHNNIVQLVDFYKEKDNIFLALCLGVTFLIVLLLN